LIGLAATCVVGLVIITRIHEKIGLNRAFTVWSSGLEYRHQHDRIFSVLRILRLIGIGVWIVLGLLLLAVVFPLFSHHRRGRLARWWASGLLKRVGLRLVVYGELPVGQTLVVANHVSWLDPFLLLAAFPIRFVAKSEIRHWPVIGWLAAKAGTVFIERQRSRDVSRVARLFARHLQDGEVVGMFPESTTSDGTYLRPFKTSLFQVALAPGVQCVPVGLRYNQPGAAWIDEMGFVESIWQIAGMRDLQADVWITPAIRADGLDRRALAARSEQAVSAVLCQEVRRNPPAQSDDLPDEGQ